MGQACSDVQQRGDRSSPDSRDARLPRGRLKSGRRLRAPERRSLGCVSDVAKTIEAVWKIESTRLIAAIARVTHDIGVAEEMEQLQKDFDHIAVLSERESDIGGIYDGYLLNFVPALCRRALEVGCGTATFTRQLAKRANQVTAIDLSSEMIRIAGERSALHPNIDFTVGNVLEMDLAVSQFDCIVMIATLHHL